MTRNRRRIEAPIANWPGLEILEREQAVRITGAYRAPSAWWSAVFPLLTMLATIFVLPWSCISTHGGNLERMGFEFAATYTICFVVGMFVLLAVCEHFGRTRNLRVKLSADTIEINGKSYVRSPGYNQFEIDEHEKAFVEERAARSGQGLGRVYRDAMQVVMRYGERRIPVASFGRRDIRKAEALLGRLQSITAPGGLETVLAAAKAVQPAHAERDDFGTAPPIR